MILGGLSMRYHVRTALEFVTKSLIREATCRSTKNASEKPLLLFDTCEEKHVVDKWDYPWWYPEKAGFPTKPGGFPVQNHLLGWCLASCAYIFQWAFANTSAVSGQAGKKSNPRDCHRHHAAHAVGLRWTLSTTTTRLEHGRVASAICHSRRSPVDLLHLQWKPHEIRIRCHRFARKSNNE